MIETHIADRLGACLNVKPGDPGAWDEAVARIRRLGIRHARIDMTAGLLDEAPALDRLFLEMGQTADVLVSLDAQLADPEDGSVLQRLLDHHGRYVKYVELRLTGDAAHAGTSLSAGASLVRRHGKQVVVGLDKRRLGEQMRWLAASDVPDDVLAVGVDMGVVDAQCRCDDHLQTALTLLRDVCPGLPAWIASESADDAHSTVLAFLNAVDSSAERIYWNVLDDVGGLLGRLLETGVEGVRRLAAISVRSVSFAGMATRPVLVTGGAGFIGANLVDRLASEGRNVVIYDALTRPGVERNLYWLKRRHPTRVSFRLGDVRDEQALAQAASGAQAVFHLAGQVAVTASMVAPLADFEVNARGTIALLDALRRHNPNCPLVFASTNKVYGDLSDIELVLDGDRYVPTRDDVRRNGIGESRPLCFHTPYGCSKGAADQYVLDYAHSFGLRTAVLRMSCIYGERQLGTEDQGWVAHFLLRAIAGEQVTIYGDGRQVRDVLHVGDAIDAYMAAWRNIGSIAGNAYNLGGGPANAISLLQLIDHIETLLGRRMDVEFSSWRPGDQRYFVADTGAIRRDLALPKSLDWKTGLARLAEHFGAKLATSATVTEAAL